MRDDVFQLGSRDASAECVWMQAGVVGYKLCDHQFDCDHCPFDLAIRDGGHIAAASPPPSAAPRPPLSSSPLERVDVAGLGACAINRSVFYHPGHLWARVEDGGRVRVGLDDFAQRLVGRFYAVGLPHPGHQAQAGTTCWRISHQAGDTALLAPVPGIVRQLNPRLAERPSLVNCDPYGEGWAFVIEPTLLEQSLKSLYYGERAARWFADSLARFEAEAGKFIAASSPAIGATMADGGLAVEDLHLVVNADQLQKLINSFLSHPAECPAAGEARNRR
jgi:glycine cleavage system H lipoate-binding protein